MSPRGTLALCCIHIPQFHITVYLASMLQGSWHIAEGNNGQKAHISSQDGLKNFITSTFNHVHNILRLFDG